MTEWVPGIVGVLALGVSVWAIVESKGATRKTVLLGERMLHIERVRERDRHAEARRAKVVAFMDGPSNERKLFIKNEGVATAREISIRIDGVPPSNHQSLLDAGPPSGVLGPRAQFGMRLLCVANSPRSLGVVVVWEDESGAPGRWASDLSF